MPTEVKRAAGLAFGADDLRLPDELRGPLRTHLADFRERYVGRGWARRVDPGQRPALIVIDLALWWTDPGNHSQLSNVDTVVEAPCRLWKAARAGGIPIFFTTWVYDRAIPPSPHDRKVRIELKPGDEKRFQLDPRLERRSGERLIAQRYASRCKGTHLHENTSPCVYVTCRDATDTFRVSSLRNRHKHTA